MGPLFRRKKSRAVFVRGILPAKDADGIFLTARPRRV
jgi:hypothetical protein